MKILIIDDEEFFIENLAEYLRKKIPAEISYVSRAEQALQRLKKERFELVICDLNLPDQAEGELVVSINKLNPHQQFIIISAISENEMPKCIRENKNLNIKAYFEKPFNIVSITNKILAIKKSQNKKSIEA
jgi:DNA-binding NtrC family response regulator